MSCTIWTETERERCRLYLLEYCPWMSLLLLLYCPSLFFLIFFTARRTLVYTRGSHLISISLLLSLLNIAPGSPSRGGDVTVYVCDIKKNRACPLLFSLFLYLFLSFCGPFNCISFHQFSRQLSAFSLCSFGLISALLVLSDIY